MTLTEMRTRLREMTDHELTDDFPDAAVDSLLNDVYAEMWQEADWPFTYREAEVTTDVHGAGFLPEEVRHVETVTLLPATPAGSERVLDGSPSVPGWSGWTRPNLPMDPATTFDGGQTKFAVSDDGLQLWVYPVKPGHGARVRLRYQSAPPLLEGPAATPAFGREFHAGVVYGAAARLLGAEADESGRPGNYQTEYLAVLKRMRRTYLQAGRAPFVMGGRGRR